jgi:hypothetical protein
VRVSCLLPTYNRPPERQYAEIGTRPVEKGTFELRPHWRIDWVAEVGRALRAEAGRQVAAGSA